jgi:hypothetical protein
MQIHIPTWGPIADREDINLFRIEDNVALGVRILKQYIDQFGLWEGVKHYRGWVATEESNQSADEYVVKVRRIYDPSFVPPTPEVPALETSGLQ